MSVERTGAATCADGSGDKAGVTIDSVVELSGVTSSVEIVSTVVVSVLVESAGASTAVGSLDVISEATSESDEVSTVSVVSVDDMSTTSVVTDWSTTTSSAYEVVTANTLIKISCAATTVAASPRL